MTVYTVIEKSVEYNDQDFNFQGDGGTPVKAFRDLKNADAERDRLNAEKIKAGDCPIEGEDKPDYFEVVAVQLEDADPSEYADTRAKIKKLREDATNAAKAEFEKDLAKVFEANPKLEQFSWTQYTPYFNDGDTCTFSVNKDYVAMTFDGQELEEVGAFDLTYAESECKDNPAMKKAIADALAFVRKFDDEDLQSMFDDHVRVVCTRDGVEAEEYEHD